MSDSSDSARTATSQDGEPRANVTVRRARKVRVSTAPDTKPEVCQIKMIPFAPEDPEIWFAMLEGQFAAHGIMDDRIKFSNVVIGLDIAHAKAVKDIIKNPPSTDSYDKIKAELIKRLSASNEKKVMRLLTHEELGDRKPSQFLRHLQDLAGPSVPENFIKSIWSSRLPQSIQTILASQPSHSLEELSDLADRIQDIITPGGVVASTAVPVTVASGHQNSEIAELRKMVEQLTTRMDRLSREPRREIRRPRPRRRASSSSSRTRSQSSYRRHPMCWYHFKFGSNAHRCQLPCDFEKSGNAKGSR
ncbi:uncharacterized protein [Epargyreus clarus]|uniref:uncharacterized protein n=1 Tax=Epargyreus clarus TaxID=520877 RepID=UPI003C2B9648